jgi:hypothetical protein
MSAGFGTLREVAEVYAEELADERDDCTLSSWFIGWKRVVPTAGERCWLLVWMFNLGERRGAVEMMCKLGGELVFVWERKPVEAVAFLALWVLSLSLGGTIMDIVNEMEW